METRAICGVSSARTSRCMSLRVSNLNGSPTRATHVGVVPQAHLCRCVFVSFVCSRLSVWSAYVGAFLQPHSWGGYACHTCVCYAGFVVGLPSAGTTQTMFDPDLGVVASGPRGSSFAKLGLRPGPWESPTKV